MRFTIGVLLAMLLGSTAQAELIDDVNDRNELRIAVEATTPPYNFKDNEQLTGFEIELGQALAREMDLGVSFVVVSDGDLLEGVESGRYDIALNQVALTPQLKERLDYSEPYRNDGQALVIPFQKGNPAFHSSVERALQRIKDDGRLELLTQKWFAPPTSNASAP